MAESRYRIGYNTNGFAHHRLDDALRVIAELGYGAVALTPDANHLPPDHTTDAELRMTRALLERLGLAVVIETGARYVLDPRRKHRPTLVDADAAERARRLEFLVRCAHIAAALGGDVVSLWSGIPGADVSADDAWRFLADGVVALRDRIAPLGVRIAFEPEPGMLVSSLADWERLREMTAFSDLGLTLDVGHVPCTESVPSQVNWRRMRWPAQPRNWMKFHATL
jgi:sugar phosphate isomerase/epimerase